MEHILKFIRKIMKVHKERRLAKVFSVLVMAIRARGLILKKNAGNLWGLCSRCLLPDTPS